MLKKILIGAGVVALVGAVYVRLSPSDISTFHVAPVATVAGDVGGSHSFQAARQITAPAADVLRAVDTVATSTQRTYAVAGSIGEGLVTYQTRSALMGYPDYTTVTVMDGPDGPLLVILAQSRFGQSDLGVNRARVEEWLARLGPLVVPLG
ncbi:Protein of unknown function [Loktanella fryxellensis]|uniref:DUF1499 domain-containing protein n=1 Tax=Loktanella fryxellensis TaxID=245187 RepID=A0A1H8F423_9RHOB|nr:DUF1499 domain-containing protein [Loktanella fryxellensis]SEN26449.1 Protein of unknown function [Loktanella fryxellensis]